MTQKAIENSVMMATRKAVMVAVGVATLKQLLNVRMMTIIIQQVFVV